jgi:uncharacterized short protein YbdD (DUF466 family)
MTNGGGLFHKRTNNMVKKRIPERDHGITGEAEVAEYDKFQRHLRDKGILEIVEDYDKYLMKMQKISNDSLQAICPRQAAMLECTCDMMSHN